MKTAMVWGLLLGFVLVCWVFSSWILWYWIKEEAMRFEWSITTQFTPISSGMKVESICNCTYLAVWLPSLWLQNYQAINLYIVKGFLRQRGIQRSWRTTSQDTELWQSPLYWDPLSFHRSALRPVKAGLAQPPDLTESTDCSSDLTCFPGHHAK